VGEAADGHGREAARAHNDTFPVPIVTGPTPDGAFTLQTVARKAFEVPLSDWLSLCLHPRVRDWLTRPTIRSRALVVACPPDGAAPGDPLRLETLDRLCHWMVKEG